MKAHRAALRIGFVSGLAWSLAFVRPAAAFQGHLQTPPAAASLNYELGFMVRIFDAKRQNESLIIVPSAPMTVGTPQIHSNEGFQIQLLPKAIGEEVALVDWQAWQVTDGKSVSIGKGTIRLKINGKTQVQAQDTISGCLIEMNLQLLATPGVKSAAAAKVTL